MSDDLIARLREAAHYADEYEGERELWTDAADALEEQAREIRCLIDSLRVHERIYEMKDARIAELEKMLAVHRLAVDVDALKARIAELEAAQLAQDKLILDYCSRITELEAENRALRNEYKAVNQELTEMQGKYETTRAALGEKE